MLKADIDDILFEIYLKKNKWLSCGGYNNHNRNISGYLKALGNCLDIFIKNDDNFWSWVIIMLKKLTHIRKLSVRHLNLSAL